MTQKRPLHGSESFKVFTSVLIESPYMRLLKIQLCIGNCWVTTRYMTIDRHSSTRLPTIGVARIFAAWGEWWGVGCTLFWHQIL